MSDWTEEWVGEIGGGWWNLHYADYFLLLTFGGIPWQVTLKQNTNRISSEHLVTNTGLGPRTSLYSLLHVSPT